MGVSCRRRQGLDSAVGVFLSRGCYLEGVPACLLGVGWGQSAGKGPRLSLRCLDCFLDDLDVYCVFWKHLQLITYTFSRDHDRKYISWTWDVGLLILCWFCLFVCLCLRRVPPENTIHIVGFAQELWKTQMFSQVRIPGQVSQNVLSSLPVLHLKKIPSLSSREEVMNNSFVQIWTFVFLLVLRQQTEKQKDKPLGLFGPFQMSRSPCCRFFLPLRIQCIALPLGTASIRDCLWFTPPLSSLLILFTAYTHEEICLESVQPSTHSYWDEIRTDFLKRHE